MNTRTLILAAAVSLSGTSMAQSFNTISDTRPRYKVEQTIAPKTKEASSENDPSLVYTSFNETITVPSDLSAFIHSPLGRPLFVTSPYGWRRDPFDHSKSSFHSGLDLRAKYEPVYAMLPGRVAKVGYDKRSGNYVTLQHGNLHISYCHLSYIGIAEGSAVYAGQPIAVSGNSGQSQSPHLHLGIKYKGQPFNPTVLLNYIATFFART